MGVDALCVDGRHGRCPDLQCAFRVFISSGPCGRSMRTGCRCGRKRSSAANPGSQGTEVRYVAFTQSGYHLAWQDQDALSLGHSADDDLSYSRQLR